MSDIETAVKASRQIEDLLEQRFRAKGRGLHEKLTSAQNHLPESIVRKGRYIASVRNAVVHDHDATIRDRPGFDRAVAEVLAHLKAAPTRQPVQAAAPARAFVARPDRRKRAVAFTWGLVVSGIGAALLLVALSGLAQPPHADAATKTGPERPAQLPQIGR